jgi:hypothetical protein
LGSGSTCVFGSSFFRFCASKKVEMQSNTHVVPAALVNQVRCGMQLVISSVSRVLVTVAKRICSQQWMASGSQFGMLKTLG